MPIQPDDVGRLLVIIFGGLAVLTPVLGLTARFALKPIAEAIARARASQGSGEALRMLERRVALLEQEAQAAASLREEVQRLSEAQEFHLRLASSRALSTPEP